jgi:thymidylate kinase
MNPDLVCVLALQDERVRRQRIQNRSGNEATDTFESLPEEFQTSMQSGYVRYAGANNINVIDASKSPAAVQADIWRQVEPLFAK